MIRLLFQLRYLMIPKMLRFTHLLTNVPISAFVLQLLQLFSIHILHKMLHLEKKRNCHLQSRIQRKSAQAMTGSDSVKS